MLETRTTGEARSMAKKVSSLTVSWRRRNVELFTTLRVRMMMSYHSVKIR